MKTKIYLSLLIGTSILLCGAKSPYIQVNKAISYIQGHSKFKNIYGVVNLTEMKKSVIISGYIKGLPPSTVHGFHIHQFGDLGNFCLNTGTHYNPYNKKHGGPHDPNRHFGDFGNLRANNKGEITIHKSDNIARLTGKYSAIGRAFVLHERRDNYSAQPVGDAGGRVACGVIGIAN